jgi:hypothetical protein
MAVIVTLVLGTLGRPAGRLAGRRLRRQLASGRRRRAGGDVRDDRGRTLRSGDAARHDRDRAAAASCRRMLVTITAVLELLGAAGLLYPPTRVAAAVCLFALKLVMFPANVYAARIPNPPKSMTSRLDVRTAEEIVYLGGAIVVGLGGIQ